jgi:uncharacterized membrane protein YhaH (DUF805 family)
MSEDDESFGCFSTAWVYIGYVASFIGLPVAAYLLWDEHRGLAWIAILGVVTGFMPYIGLPVAVGFIVYALTENPARSFVAGIAAIAVAYGPILVASYFESRKREDDEASASDWAAGAVGTGYGVQETYDQRFASQEPKLSPIPVAVPVMANQGSRYCGQCGTPATQDARFCESCGVRLTSRGSSGPDLSTSYLQPAVVNSFGRTAPIEAQPSTVAGKNFDIRRLLSFEGRMARKDFIVLSAILWLAFVPLVFLAGWAQTDSCRQGTRPDLFSAAVCSDGEALLNQHKDLLVLALWIIWGFIGWTASVRRSHDFGWSGWVVFILNIIPFVGLIFYVMLLIRRGDNGVNRYGHPNSGTPLPVLHR